VRDGAQPLHALVRVQMTAGIDPDCFEACLRGGAGGITCRQGVPPVATAPGRLGRPVSS
jgi:hypothetical protein